MINLDKPAPVASPRKAGRKTPPSIALAAAQEPTSASDPGLWAAGMDVAGDVAESLLSSTPDVVDASVVETLLQGAGDMLTGAGEVLGGLAEGAADLGSALAEGLADLFSGW